MTVSSEKARKVREKKKFPGAVTEKVEAVIPLSASFVSVGCMRDVLVIELP